MAAYGDIYPSRVSNSSARNLAGNTSPVCPCSRHFMYQQTIPYSRIQVFPLFFVIAMGLWGFFGSIFFVYPDIHLLPSIRPLMYTAISFGGPTFMLFCFSYAFPHKKNVDEILTVYFYPSLRFFTVRHPATPYSNIPSFLPMRSGPFPTGILSNTTASCFLYTPSIVPEQFYWAVQCSFRLCQVQFAISFLKKAANPSCCVKQNLLLEFY